MAKYKCPRCGYIFDDSEMRIFGKGKVKCPKCTYEIVYKVARPYRLVKAI
ncbi:MAG: DNA-directed RNA polymerase subunit P [Desulfurococcaceae archaeon]